MGALCFFNTAIAWGGGEKWHFETSSYMHAQGHQVLVIAHPKSVLLQKLKDTSIPHVSLAVSNLSFLNPFAYLKLIRLLKSQKVSRIVLNLSRDLKLAGVCAQKLNIQPIIYRRGSAIPIKNTFLNRYYFKKVVTHVLANSHETKKTVLANNTTLFPENRITVIHNGVQVADFKNENAVQPPTQNQKIIVSNLGRLEYQKNQKFLIEVAQELQKRKLPFRMHIGGEGSLKESLQEQINQAKLQEQVFLPGFIENPKEFLSKSDIFLLPSHWEGFGYVLAEAALCKKPIVAFKVSSNPELVRHNITGLLTPPNELSTFADAVEKLAKDSSLRQQMGEAGFNYICANYDIHNQLEKVETYLLETNENA